MSDFSDQRVGRARMAMASADWVSADAIFLVGSNIRHDQPILGHRVRTAWRQSGAEIMDLNPVAYECHFDLSQRLITPPQRMIGTLAAMSAVAAEQANKDLPAWIAQQFSAVAEHQKEAIEHVVGSLKAANRGLIVLGDGGLYHPQAGLIQALLDWLSEVLEVSLCVLGGPANAQGAHQMGAVPGPGGLHAKAMLEQPLKSYLIYDFEPGSDTADSQCSMETLQEAAGVVAITAFASEQLLSVADVLLPLASVPQVEGSYINLDGIEQSFEAAVAPSGEARPGWKILRRLGADLGLDGFDFIDLQAINQDIAQSVNQSANQSQDGSKVNPEILGSVAGPFNADSLVRIGDVPIYHCDSLVRRSKPLQDSDHAKAPVVRVHPETASRLNLVSGQAVAVSQNGQSLAFEWVADERIAPHAVWLPSAQPEVIGLGANYGAIELQGANSD